MFKAIAPAISVIVTQAYVDHPENKGSYFRVGDEVHISERQRQYYVVRNGEFLGGKPRNACAAEHGRCDPEWVAVTLSYGGFVNMADELPPVPRMDYSLDDALPPAPTNELYVSNTGRRTASIRLELTSISISTDASPRRVRVSVETARAMAHDLIRMAAELERQEKANESGE